MQGGQRAKAGDIQFEVEVDGDEYLVHKRERTTKHALDRISEMFENLSSKHGTLTYQKDALSMPTGSMLLTNGLLPCVSQIHLSFWP